MSLEEKGIKTKMKVSDFNQLLLDVFFFFFVFFPFLGPLPLHVEVSRLGVKSEL